ncbi:hypothetical protein [Bacillus sp. 165]|uniref:hypothetical protein n=1 Tax=Bacillus sp. 165 TaxID=1529117 RepID=UPI001ADA5D9A|nr:hypothetical protein [Bacillus sp. 165]MBO9128968.1 hypothetical protein [Bacillus sp. 165]
MKKQGYLYVAVFLFCIGMMPAAVFAASDDPTVIVKNVANGIINFFMIVAPSIGTAAIMAMGVMYSLTNSAGKKSQYKSNMKETFFIVAVVMSSGIIMKWFLGLLG